MKNRETAHGRIEEREVCLICGKRPDSFYARVRSDAEWHGLTCSLLGIDVDRLLKDHREAAGIVCLGCLLASRRRDISPSMAPC